MPCKSATVPAAVNPVSARDVALHTGHCPPPDGKARRVGQVRRPAFARLPRQPAAKWVGNTPGIIGRLFRTFPRNRTVRIHRYSFQWVVLNQFSKRNRTNDPLSLPQYHTYLWSDRPNPSLHLPSLHGCYGRAPVNRLHGLWPY